MANDGDYREEAKRCRARAAAATDPQLAAQLLRFAADYDALAALVENGDTPPPGQAMPIQQQPVQQQQQKAADGTAASKREK